jgi:hypothetical protein
MAGALGSWSFSNSGPFQTTSTAFVHSPEHATKSKPPRIDYVPLKREARILQAETELMSFRMRKGCEEYGSQVNETGRRQSCRLKELQTRPGNRIASG